MTARPIRGLLAALHDVDFADSRYRVYQYVPALREAGIEPRVEPLVSRELAALYWRGGWAVRSRRAWLGMLALLARARLALLAPRYDVTLVQREWYPFGPPILETLTARRGARLVYDFDDALWTAEAGVGHQGTGDEGQGSGFGGRGSGDSAPAQADHGPRTDDRPQTTDHTTRNTQHAASGPRPPNPVARLRYPPGKTARLVRLSRVTIAGNDYLAGWARRHGSDVRVVPTVVDTKRYPIKRHEPGRPVVVGWVGSPTTAAYLEPLRPVFRQLAARPDVRLLFVGAPGFRPDGWPAEVRPWRLDRELADLLDLDVGLMPQPDTAWTRGKCAFKAIQYMAAGIPAVASPVGVATRLIEPDLNGCLADSADAWLDAITRLVEDAARRARLGAAARATIEAGWSLRVWAPAFVQALRDAAG